MDRLVWHDRGRLLAPDTSRAFAARAVKDPSVVYHDGAWHLFYTAVGRHGTRSIGYTHGPHLEDVARYPLLHLHFDNSMFDYTKEAAAPFIFYYGAHRLWYLIFQIPSPAHRSYIPVYATNASLDPTTWSAPQSLLPRDAPVEKRRIDFWIVANQTHFFLFYWDNAGGTWCLECSRGRFPHGFAQERRLFSLVEPAWEIHEGGCVYWVADQGMYLMLVESVHAASREGRRVFPDAGQSRFYSALTACDLRGPWYVVDSPVFAQREDVQTREQPRWIHNISHGEVIRSNITETPMITSQPIRFLIQSQADPFVPAASFRYGALRWHLGLIELERLPLLRPWVRPSLQVAPVR